MKIINWNTLSSLEKKTILQRPTQADNSVRQKQVRQIIDRVKTEDDLALYNFTQQFDKAQLESLQVSEQELELAKNQINKDNRTAIEFAIDKITTYQMSLRPKNISINTADGVCCERQPRPINNVGLYVPGGNTPLISTVMMLAIPAAIAGCQNRILCTPPKADGSIDPNLLFAALNCGITKIYKVGGAQAIAAMAFGTETILKVDKIFGPGNGWVTEAKKIVSQVRNGADCDMPAGPSELLVIADDNADPTFVAADLLSQAEHGPDSQVIAITLSTTKAEAIRNAVNKQLIDLPRKAIAKQALAHSQIIITESIEKAVGISNQYAPEHLILQIDKAENIINDIMNAGAVFIGPWTPETAGDYVTGANHVLPTEGYARTLSGLSVLDFMKFISVQRVSQSGLSNIAKSAERLASMEGLEAHKNAVSLRLEKVVEYLC